jgi:hypothetical protein
LQMEWFLLILESQMLCAILPGLQFDELQPFTEPTPMLSTRKWSKKVIFVHSILKLLIKFNVFTNYRVICIPISPADLSIEIYCSKQE